MAGTQLLLLCSLLFVNCCYSFKISAFNVRIFGTSTMEDKDNHGTVNTLVKIIRRYDIIFIQEIRDASETAIYQLLAKVNEGSRDEYDMLLSSRLGRSRSKEQYAYIYKKGKLIKSIEAYQYDDRMDVFEREPYAVKVTTTDPGLPTFVLIGVHIKPDNAVQELDDMIGVHEHYKLKFGTDNILILGDMNADCSYVGKGALKGLLLKATGYNWLIGDEVDTTITNSDCTYDRFIMTGNTFMHALRESSVQVFNFDKEYDLTSEQALDVSDHYPIELTLDIYPHSAKPSNSSGRVRGFLSKTINKLHKFFNYLVQQVDL